MIFCRNRHSDPPPHTHTHPRTQHKPHTQWYRLNCSTHTYAHTTTHTVVQAELLQTQTEVRMLLERVGEVARERTESVSSKVHTQLLQLADERAMVAEQHAQDMEREVH